MNNHKISIRPYTLTILPYNTLLSPVYDFTGACVVALTKIRLCCVIHTYSWCWCLVSWMCSLSFSEPELAVSAAGVAFLSVCMCVRVCVTCCSHCTMLDRERETLALCNAPSGVIYKLVASTVLLYVLNPSRFCCIQHTYLHTDCTTQWVHVSMNNRA